MQYRQAGREGRGKPRAVQLSMKADVTTINVGVESEGGIYLSGAWIFFVVSY